MSNERILVVDDKPANLKFVSDESFAAGREGYISKPVETRKPSDQVA